MNKSILCFVGCWFGLLACNVEHYEDCEPDPFGDGDDFGGTHSSHAGSSGSGHAGSGGSAIAQAGSGGSAATAGSSDTGGGPAQTSGGEDSGTNTEAGAPAASPTPCQQERDCAAGYNCDLDQHECLPAAQETCGELGTELACTNRKDCTPVYGGVNCSCGNNCECHGGEPGCVCESFQFFICQDSP